jgi:DNA-binding transcriptional LysR family regulator
MHRNLDIALLRSFAAAADRASMTAAANALHLTQGAVSQQIKRLEQLVGCGLFLRERRRLRLTAAGERLLAKARRVLSLNDEIFAESAGGRMEGKVRLGAPYDLAGAWLAPVLRSFAEACPQVELSLVCLPSPDLLADLTKGQIDLAIIEEPLGHSAGECLCIERLVWVGARAGQAHLRRPVPVSMVAESCAFRPAVLGALDRHGRQWRTLFENGSMEATTATVRADLAVTTWLAFTVPAGLDILGPEAGLPDLPPFAINLHLPKGDLPWPTRELGRHIRAGLSGQTSAA